MGDFNQTIPRTRAPRDVFNLLTDTLLHQMTAPTSGPVPELNALSIDHLLHTRQLRAVAVRGLSNLNDDGRRLSDHFGILVDLAPSHPA
jgi:endonuclease/exonuclease/phosphatase family metal-dependent hydrolase